jgi:outer membrane receptor for ferric coprogen and ferric-rhodotorulic acid
MLKRRGLLRAAAAVSLGASLAGGAGVAAAQERTDAQRSGPIDEVLVTGEGGGYIVEDSRSATKLDLSLRDTPQSITVMTRERLDDQNLQSLRDVLDNTPGVYSYQWDSERVLFSSRGFVVDTLMYDGVPSITNFNTDSVDETLDTALYDRIEIVRGATGLSTGSGSPAASINLVRKHAAAKSLAVQTAFTAGSWSDWRAEADVALPLTKSGNVRARLVGVLEGSESYQALYENEKRVLYGIVDADLGPRTLLSVGYDLQEYLPKSNTWGSFPLFLGDGTFADWPRDVTTATDWTFWDKNKKTGFVELRRQLARGWALRASLTSREADEDLALFYVYGFPDPATGLGLDPYADRSTGTADEKMLDLYASGPFALFGREHELVVGVNAARADLDSLEYTPGEMAPVGNFFEWDGTYPSPGFDPVGFQVADIHTRQESVYAAARFSLAERVKLIAGARHEALRMDYYYLYDSPENGFDHDYSETIPYAGLTYDFSKPFSAFVSFTEIFKPQNARAANGAYLDPLEGRSVDMGLKGEHFGGRLSTEITLFETRQDNVAEPLFDDDGAPVLLPDLTQASRPIGGTRTRGIEVEASGRLRETWNVSLGWSRYILEDADGEAVNSFIPRTTLRLFSSWTPKRRSKLALGGGVNWQSASDTFVGTPSGGTQLVQDDVALLGLFARYQLGPKTALQFNAENLLDKKYFVLDNYDNTYYGPPRNYSMGLRVRF